MKSHDPFDDIGELLRSHKPDPQPPPGLEARILRAIEARKPAGRTIWPWFILPPAAAMATVLLWPEPAPQAAVTRHDPPPQEAVEKEAPPVLSDNPLERETLALELDARRAGQFLINCLPSLGTPVE